MKAEELQKLSPEIQRILWKYSYPLGNLAYEGKIEEYRALEEKMNKELSKHGYFSKKNRN